MPSYWIGLVMVIVFAVELAWLSASGMRTSGSDQFAVALPHDAPAHIASRPGYWGMVGRRLRRDPVTILFCAPMLATVLSAVFAPLISPFDPYKESVILRLKPFGFRGHLLGTDELGRDILARILYGGRTSLLMGVVPVVFAGVVGGTLGVLAGYGGG